jgi:hypothetical protein
MQSRSTTRRVASAFDIVRCVGLRLPRVEAATKYDGSPVLRVDGCFMAGLAMDPSAEPDTLVVRSEYEAREWLLEDAPETYYVTDYHRKHPVVLVRLSRIDEDALRDLLSSSYRLTVEKSRKRPAPANPTRARGRDRAARRGTPESPSR